MFRKTVFLAAPLLAAALTGCGTSSPGPEGSKRQTQTGVSPSGYPAGKPVDAESPALASSTEQLHSEVSPKVPKEEHAPKGEHPVEKK